MKRLLLASTVLAGLTAAASAADLPRRAAPPVFVPVPVFTWTGFYLGFNAGYGFDAGTNSNVYGIPAGSLLNSPGTAGTLTLNRSNQSDGFVGGAQIGFNYQFTPGSGFVVGVEADIQWADFGGNNNNGFFGNNLFRANPVAPFGVPGFGIVEVPVTGANVALFNNGGFGNRGRDSDWFATARLRVGYAFDRVLVYATGGFAFTDDGNGRGFLGGFTNGGQLPAAFYVSPGAALTGSFVNNGGGLFGRKNNDDFGWVLGAGVEYAWTNNLTVKLEGLWVNFDNNNNNGFFGGNTIVGVSNTGAAIRGNNFGLFGLNRGGDDDFFIARVGINYKFGS